MKRKRGTRRREKRIRFWDMPMMFVPNADHDLAAMAEWLRTQGADNDELRFFYRLTIGLYAMCYGMSVYPQLDPSVFDWTDDVAD
jgi:hypothetical protein